MRFAVPDYQFMVARVARSALGTRRSWRGPFKTHIRIQFSSPYSGFLTSKFSDSN